MAQSTKGDEDPKPLSAESNGAADANSACNRCWVLVGAMSLCLIHEYMMHIARGQTDWYPLPLLMLLASWTIVFGVILIDLVAFLASSWSLLLSPPRRPRVFPWLALGIGILNVWWLVISWQADSRWRSESHILNATVISALTTPLFVGLAFASSRIDSFRVWLAARWLFFLWLGWMAFPYFGELP